MQPQHLSSRQTLKHLLSAHSAMLWSENDLLNYLFKSFAAMQDAYHTGKISRDKYFEWKLQWSYDSALPISASPKEAEKLLGYNK